MIVEPVDDSQRLFSIIDVVPDELVTAITSLDWDTIPWRRGNGQETWSRRELIVDAIPALVEYNNLILESKAQLEDIAKVKFEGHPFTMWWYDEPSFTVSLHTDGHLPSSLQVFWESDGTDYGTAFYEYKDPETVNKQFEFIPNTGYMMLNGLDDDGSQPLQWHGMLNPVLTRRICSYSQFGTYKLVK